MTENRAHPRKPLHSSVTFQVGDGAPVEGVCRDVSLGGMFIETPTPQPYGTVVRVAFSLAGNKKDVVKVVVASTVRWSTPEGMGVQFGVMGVRETNALTTLFAAAAQS